MTYQHDGMTFKGVLAWDDKVQGKRPGVLVVHEFWGLNDYAKKRAQQLAELGYVAFACDMYGEGKVTEHPKEAAKMAGEVRKDVKAWRGRALAALKILQDHELVDSKKLASIGYCFGGSTSLQLAYAGADIAAVVSFHGALPGGRRGPGQEHQGQDSHLPRQPRYVHSRRSDQEDALPRSTRRRPTTR